MIEYRMVLLNDLETINEECEIKIQYGTEVVVMCGEMVRSFVRCTNKGYERFPEEDVLEEGLRLIPSQLRYIYRFLYEKLNDVIM